MSAGSLLPKRIAIKSKQTLLFFPSFFFLLLGSCAGRNVFCARLQPFLSFSFLQKRIEAIDIAAGVVCHGSIALSPSVLFLLFFHLAMKDTSHEGVYRERDCGLEISWCFFFKSAHYYFV